MKKLLKVSMVAMLVAAPFAANATPTYGTVPAEPVDATAVADVASTSYVKGAYNAAIAVANAENQRALAAEGNLVLGGTAADWNGADDLTEAVNAAMDKARAAASAGVQTLAAGDTAGTLKINGTDVAINTFDAAGAATAAENNAKAYADSLASNYDAAGAASTAETNAKAYADGLASNYDAAGAASTAETNAKAYADGLASNYDAAGSAATAEQNAKDYADGLASNYATANQGAKADAAETLLGNTSIGAAGTTVTGAIAALQSAQTATNNKVVKVHTVWNTNTVADADVIDDPTQGG